VDSLNKVQVGLIRRVNTFTIPNGSSVTMQELMISFQSNRNLIIMEIVVPLEIAQQILSPFETLVDAIKVNIP